MKRPVAERRYPVVVNGRPATLALSVARPVSTDGSYKCFFEVRLDDELAARKPIFGVDSLQALLGAVRIASVEARRLLARLDARVPAHMTKDLAALESILTRPAGERGRSDRSRKTGRRKRGH